MKILTIVGARPQFIKAAPVSRKIREEYKEILVHTGQHYDINMSQVFFDKLKIPQPDYNLNIGSFKHGEQTGRMLIGIERILLKENPDMVLVYGDTNSTLGGALATSKLNIPLAHIEAGLRSYNKKMPEEINRIITDHLSSLLFCPTKNAVDNLKKEGIIQGVYNTGDVMYDSILYYSKILQNNAQWVKDLNINPGKYYLATIHRPENTENKENLSTVLKAFNNLNQTVVFPVHPRTLNRLKGYGINKDSFRNIQFINPVDYLDMLKLIMNCLKVFTDSGGIQKEAYFLDKPCITLREQTEWVETLKGNWNVLVQIEYNTILKAHKEQRVNYQVKEDRIFGVGRASEKILGIIEDFYEMKKKKG